MTTAVPPDPDPERTPGLVEGGSVDPGDTPPAGSQTSGLAAPQPGQQGRSSSIGRGQMIGIGLVVGVFLIVAVLLVILVVGVFA